MNEQIAAKTFTASNGVRVKQGSLGLVVTDGSIPNTVIASNAHEPALREFMRDEEDRHLGRWRWPENPDYVVYGFDPRSTVIRVVYEADGLARAYYRDDMTFASADNDLRRAARAYFDAHPEPKPWHDAKPGEAWMLTVDDEPDVPAIASSSESGRTIFTAATYGAGGTEELAPTTSRISEGRRLHPEVS